MTRRIRTVLILATAIMILHFTRPAGGARLDETEFRSMYVMSCSAGVDRLDIESDRLLESFFLDKKTAKQHLLPNVDAHMDSCLIFGAAYDPAHAILFTVAPEEPHYAPGDRQHFRVLGFHLPDFQLVEKVQIEPSFEDAEPSISLQHGRLQATILDRVFSVPTGVARGVAKLVSIQPPPQPKPEDPDFSSLLGNPQARDLERFARIDKETGVKQLLTWRLEASGGTNLVRVLHGEDEPLIIAAIHGPHAAVLVGLPQTLEQNVHLTPGGQYVYVEEALPPLSSIGSRKTGRVALFEAATGKMVKNWTIPGIQNQSFLAFTPNGKVIYHDGENYTFESVAPSFPDLPVEPMRSALTWFFTRF